VYPRLIGDELGMGRMGQESIAKKHPNIGFRFTSQHRPSCSFLGCGRRIEGTGVLIHLHPFACIGPIVWAALGTVAELCTEMQVETGSLSSQLVALLLRPEESMLARDFLFPHFSHEPPPSTVL
jgi:hypothetical protein